ncbi:hypothetical protein CVD28_27125 [Bacillus sp. M6-12]|uniref:aminoglycoside phosphotransferase family protein n=1 Tax=Bacillus sp. M6-12 TaxID=2054166 RepID=UPI000C777A60|nr:aminoglycoside phosphotransferase family protein [Bacillus sp. M6-12]PLS14643.1 hypothetical protein CVD28_27125 [Bacillus sp. M6-12]
MIHQIFDQLKDKYGNFYPVRLTGGYTNETFLLKGVQPLLVAKVSRTHNKDVQNEINCLRLMEESGAAPKFYELVNSNVCQITLMEYRKGENGQSILDHNEMERTKELYKKLGKSLAKSVHSKKYNTSPFGIRKCNLQELNLYLDFVPEVLRNESKEILESINDRKEKWVLTHGDYGIHNVLFTKDNAVTILDWEWGEWASPLTDIGWICWFTKLHYPEYANMLNRLFLEEYTQNNDIPLARESLKAYCVYKVWKVLDRVKNGSVEARQEWVRRLQWTIETDIFNPGSDY